MGLIDNDNDNDIDNDNDNDDRRPRDWAYIATFNEKDLPSLQDMIKKINATHDTGLIEEFNRKCEQNARNPNITTSIENMTIQTVSKSDDLVLTAGLRHCINIILGLTSARWSHFGMSGGSNPVAAISDTVLNAETIANRQPLAWAEPVGMRLLFGALSGQISGGGRLNILGEIGVYNGSAAGAVLLNRSTFFSNTVDQKSAGLTDVASAPIIVSAVIDFCPVS